jgi:hypothetical protein
MGHYTKYESPEDKARSATMYGQDYDALYRYFIAKANNEQLDFFKRFQAAVKRRIYEREHKKLPKEEIQRLHFITGDGGVGKTFLYNVI